MPCKQFAFFEYVSQPEQTKETYRRNCVGDKASEVDIPEADLEMTMIRSGGAGESFIALAPAACLTAPTTAALRLTSVLLLDDPCCSCWHQRTCLFSNERMRMWSSTTRPVTKQLCAGGRWPEREQAVHVRAPEAHPDRHRCPVPGAALPAAESGGRPSCALLLCNVLACTESYAAHCGGGAWRWTCIV